MDLEQEISEGNQVAKLPDPVSNQDTDPIPATTSKRFVCDICPYRANKANLVDIHKICHKYQPGNRFKCKYCPYFVSVMRCLYQHMRLHPEHKEQLYSACDPDLRIGDTNEDSRQSTLANIAYTQKGGKQTCNQCPFVCKSRNGMIYHKQFHRARPSATIKCSHCSYWVEQKHQLHHHQKVHSPSYGAKANGTAVNHSSVPMGSPAKSDMSDYCDTIEMATLKQQIINSKIRGCPLTPEKFIPYDDDREGKMDISESDIGDKYCMQGYVVDENGQILKTGSLRKVHICSKCPYTNVKIANLKLHETMHELLTQKTMKAEDTEKGQNDENTQEPEKIFKCDFCSYNTLKKKLLSQHIKVHSQQYEPGCDDIIDFEGPEMAASVDAEDLKHIVDDGEDDPEVQLKRPAEIEPEEHIVKRPKVSSGPRLDSGQVPSHFYVKYIEENGEHILERVSVLKFNCDRCPYATLKRIFFERHVLLHGCKQHFTCEFCDYSVPNFQLLLQHKKLHMMPNPNLLSMQSLSNLAKLPEISADVAAAANFPMNKDDPISTEGVHDHLALYENSEDFSEPKQLYRCDRCPFTNTHKENLLSHLKYHMILSALQCSFCDYSAAIEEVLTEHVKVHFSSDEQLKSVTGDDKASADINETVSCDSPSNDDGKALSLTSRGSSENKKNGDSSAVPDKVDGKELEYTDYLKKMSSEQDDSNNGQNIRQGQIEVKIERASCVCQYCDRSFQSSEKRQKHEKQHLVGQNVLD